MAVINPTMVIYILGLCFLTGIHSYYHEYYRDERRPHIPYRDFKREMIASRHHRDSPHYREERRDTRHHLVRDPLAFRHHVRDMRHMKDMLRSGRLEHIAPSRRDAPRRMRPVRREQHKKDDLHYRHSRLPLNDFFRRETVENDAGQDPKVCEEVARFAPNMCEYSSAAYKCKNICGSKEKNKDLLRCPIDPTSRKNKRVIGGRLVTHPVPWMVSLNATNAKTGKTKFWCSGSILSKDFILTASICINSMTSLNAADWSVTAAGNNVQKVYSTDQTVKVKKILTNKPIKAVVKEKDGKKFAYFPDDIAILQLETPLNLGDDDKATLCLLKDGFDNDDNAALEDCFIAGWGYTKYAEGIGGKPTSKAYEVKMPIKTGEKCNDAKVYDNTIDMTKIVCAGHDEGGKDACNYDAGGPLACRIGDTWYQKGIISSGFECARANAYGLYTRVFAYKKWVVDTILKQSV